MSLVLVIEPDRAQAEILRQIVRERLGAELVLVSSTYAAVVAMSRAAPDVVLFSHSVTKKQQEQVIAHLHSLTETWTPQVLTIPKLRGDEPPRKASRFGFRSKQTEPEGDPNAVAQRIAASLHLAQQTRPQTPDAPVDIGDPEEPLPIVDELAEDVARAQASPSDAVAGEEPDVPLPVVDDVPYDVSLAQASPVEAEEVATPVGPPSPASVDATELDLESLFDQLAKVPTSTAVAHSHDAESVRPEADEKIVNLDDSDWTGRGGVDPEVHAAEIALVQARAEAKLAAEVERVRAESAKERLAELTRLEGEAAALCEAAAAYAKDAAEADAREALAAELAKVRSESEQKLAAELSRVRAEAQKIVAEQLGQIRAEADQARDAQLAQARAEADSVRLAALEEARSAAGQAAAQALEAEVARVRAEAEARLQAELARVRDQAEQTRFAQQQVQLDAETIRDVAAREARTIAEEAAARALEAEVARVRAEADARLEAELERVRQEAEQARVAQQQAQLESQSIRETEARLEAELARVREQAEQARVAHQRAQLEAERIRELAAREARAVAEEAAARALEAEVARVRAEAEARLEAELERVRQEAEQARVAQHQAQLESRSIRDDAARAFEAEAARIRAEADERLQAELARVRAEAARARLTDQSEAERAREAAVTAARASAEAALKAETERIREEVNARLADEVARSRPKWDEAQAFTASTRVATSPRYRERNREARSRKWILPVAASLLIAVGVGLRVDVSAIVRSSVQTSAAWLTQMKTLASSHAADPAAEGPPKTEAIGEPQVKTVPTRARPARGGRARGNTPMPTDVGAVSESGPGFLAVFCRIPLDLYADGRRIGTTDDGQLLLGPGLHRLAFVNQRFKYRDEVQILIRPGQVTAYTVTLPTGSIRVDTTPGAEVWIEGTQVGTAPLGDLPVPIGTREVLVRDAQNGERRQSVEVPFGQTVHLTMPLETTTTPNVAPGPPRLGPMGGQSGPPKPWKP
jgi:hypothetical protein